MGSVYTAVLRNDTSQWLFQIGQNTYAGGVLISAGVVDSGEDGALRVSPVDVANVVPEPSTCMLAILEVTGLALRRLF